MVLNYIPIYWLLLGIVVFVVIFWGIRKLLFWYLKINERVALMEKNNQLLEKLVKQIEMMERNNRSKLNEEM